MQSIQRTDRVLSTSSNSSNSSTNSSSGKLMSISSIIASTPSMYSSHKIYHKEPMERRASAPSHPYNHPQRYPSSLLFRSPPTSPDNKSYESIPLKKSSSFHLDCDAPPLTLQERRLRNKAASAKYRQKKNQQQNEMRVMIGRLSEQNAVLERQLQELRLENQKLKATADKLRGKMVAKKMLKKWIGKSMDNYSYDSKNFNYSVLSAMSHPEHDKDITTNVATMDTDQDEDDELESISSE